jgi:carboxypeptidase family protein
LHVIITYPAGHPVTRMTLILTDRGRTVEFQRVKHGKTEFLTRLKDGLGLKCRVVLNRVGYTFEHALTPKEVQTGAVEWALPLERAGQKITCRVTNKATGDVIVGAWVGMSKKTGGGVSSGKTDKNGLVKLTKPIDPKVAVYLVCGRLPVDVPKGAWFYVFYPKKVDLGKDPPVTKIVEMPVDVPELSFRVTVKEKTKRGARVLPVNTYSVRCIPTLPPKYGRPDFLGFRDRFFDPSGKPVTLFTELPGGKYRFRVDQSDASRPRKYYVVLSPKEVTVQKGKTQDVNVVVQLADEYRGRLDGSVRGPKDALAGIAVSVRRAKGGYSRSVTTDKDGVFAFKELPGGAYSLVAKGKGHATLSQNIEIPSPRLLLQMRRVYQLTVTLAGGAGMRCVVLYQGKHELHEKSAVADARGKASLRLSEQGPFLLVAFNNYRDLKKAAFKVLRIEGDTEVAMKPLATRNVELRLTGLPEGAQWRTLVFAGVDAPAFVAAYPKNVRLPDGVYNVFLRQGKDAHMLVASQWRIPKNGMGAVIDVPKKMNKARTMQSIFAEFLKKHAPEVEMRAPVAKQGPGTTPTRPESH